MKKFITLRTINACSAALIPAGLISTVFVSKNLDDSKTSYLLKTTKTNSQIKQDNNIDPNDVISQFNKYANDKFDENYKEYQNQAVLNMTQRTSWFKGNHGTKASYGSKDKDINLWTTNSLGEDLRNTISSYNKIKDDVLNFTTDKNTSEAFSHKKISYYNDIGINPTGYALFNNANLAYMVRAHAAILNYLKDYYYDWNQPLKDNSTVTLSNFSRIISPHFIQPEINFSNYVIHGENWSTEKVRNLLPSGFDSHGYKWPKVEEIEHIGNIHTSGKENNAVLLAINSNEYNWKKLETGFFPGGSSAQYTRVNGILQYLKPFLPVYFDLYTESKCALTNYYGTDISTYLYVNGNSTIKNLVYNPSLLLQINKVGYDKENNKYYLQQTLNKELLTAALGAKYNFDFNNAYDKNGNITTNPLYVRDLSDLSFDAKGKDNPDTALYLSKDYYYGDVLGMGDIKGGQDQWAPIGDVILPDGTTGSGLRPSDYGNNGYQSQKYKDQIKNLEDILSEAAFNNFLTYDNYFAVRNWVKNYILEHHQWPDLSAYDQQQTTDPNINLAYQIMYGSLKNNGWIQDCQKYDIDPTSDETLKDLSLIIPNMTLNDWIMNDVTGDGEFNVNQLESNTSQNEYLDKDGKLSENGYLNMGALMSNGINHYITTPSNNLKNILIATNTGGSINGNNPWSEDIHLPEESPFYHKKINIEQAHNYGDTSNEWEGSNLNNLDNLSKLSNNAISSTTVKLTKSGNVKNIDSFSIKQQGNIIKSINDEELKNRTDVCVYSYKDRPQFYDETTPNPNFNAQQYELNDHDPNNQPYSLKSVQEIYKLVTSSTTDVGQILKNIFFDYKNNCPAMPFADVNMYDDDSFAYDIPTSRLDIKLDNGFITTEIYEDGVDHSKASPLDSYQVSGFETSTDPFTPDSGGLNPSKVGIIVGTTAGVAAFLAVLITIIFYRKRTTRGLSPLAKKAKKMGDYED